MEIKEDLRESNEKYITYVLGRRKEGREQLLQEEVRKLGRNREGIRVAGEARGRVGRVAQDGNTLAVVPVWPPGDCGLSFLDIAGP